MGDGAGPGGQGDQDAVTEELRSEGAEGEPTPARKNKPRSSRLIQTPGRGVTRPPSAVDVKIASMAGAGLDAREIAKRMRMTHTAVRFRLSKKVYQKPELMEVLEGARQECLDDATHGAVEIVKEIRERVKVGAERCVGLDRNTGAPVMVMEKTPVHHLAKALDSLASVAGMSKQKEPWAQEESTASISFDPKDVETMKAIAQAFLAAKQLPREGT